MNLILSDKQLQLFEQLQLFGRVYLFAWLLFIDDVGRRYNTQKIVLLFFFFFCSSEIHKVNSLEQVLVQELVCDCCILKIDVCNYSTSGDEFLSKDTATQASIDQVSDFNFNFVVNIIRFDSCY